ncbi:hypothetical protein HYX05_02675 [Candidatus Woesearchaeota archaeon]|nr:hypothetical protein [Candidatus Woesearchaeota archaeon]
MKKFTPKAMIFLILAAIGAAVAAYSIKVQNHVLTIAAILFAAVSADNIFCNLRKNGRRN